MFQNYTTFYLSSRIGSGWLISDWFFVKCNRKFSEIIFWSELDSGWQDVGGRRSGNSDGEGGGSPPTSWHNWEKNIIFKNGHDSGIDTFEVTKSENIITRTNCSRKVREIESGSLQMWKGWRGWRMIICKRPVPMDDRLQEAGPSGWSFARGWSLRIIICEELVPPNDRLQETGPSW